MDITTLIFLIGRIIVGLYFLAGAWNHFSNLNKGMATYTQSKGVPSPKIAVIVTGALLLIGAVTIATGFMPSIGILALVLFFVPVTFIMHQFWKIEDPMQKMGEQVNFMKNLGLLGAILMLSAIPQPWPLSLGG